MTAQSRTDIDRLLAESLKELAAKKPVEKITIKEITDRAGVIRPTFYNHFQDKYELIERIIQRDLFDPIEPLLGNGMTTEALVLLFTNIEKDRAFYSQLVRMEGAVTFDDVAQKCVRSVMLGMLERVGTAQTPHYKWMTPSVVANYYAQSMCSAAKGWIRMGMTVSPREMAEAYQYMLTHSLPDIVREMGGHFSGSV